MSFVYLDEKKLEIESTPDNVAPGSYNITQFPREVKSQKTPFGNSSPRSTLLRSDQFNTPGPGEYHTTQQEKEEMYLESNLQSAYQIHEGHKPSLPFKSQTKRFFVSSSSDMPGPGNYNTSKKIGKNFTKLTKYNSEIYDYIKKASKKSQSSIPGKAQILGYAVEGGKANS